MGSSNINEPTPVDPNQIMTLEIIEESEPPILRESMKESQPSKVTDPKDLTSELKPSDDDPSSYDITSPNISQLLISEQ